MGNDKPKQGNPIIGFLLLIIIALSVFFFSPGILIMATIQYIAGTNLDKSQMWTFAILICLLLWGGIWATQGKDARSTNKIYLSICLGIIFVSLILFFGFKANFIVVFLHYFF